LINFLLSRGKPPKLILHFPVLPTFGVRACPYTAGFFVAYVFNLLYIIFFILSSFPNFGDPEHFDAEAMQVSV
jgi:hypothetical protein